MMLNWRHLRTGDSDCVSVDAAGYVTPASPSRTSPTRPVGTKGLITQGQCRRSDWLRGVIPDAPLGAWVSNTPVGFRC